MKPNPEDLESLWKQLNADHTDDAVDEAAAASVQPALDDVIRQLRGQRERQDPANASHVVSLSHPRPLE